MSYIVLDFETTGLLGPDSLELYQQPHAIELAAVKLDNDLNQIDEFESFIKPPIPIPELITKITSIDDSMVADAPTYVEIRDDFAKFFFGCHTMVAHNLTFDLGILVNEERRLGTEYRFPWAMRQMCTVEKSYAIKNHRLKLSQLYELATGETSIKGAHRAMRDVVALVSCYKWLVKEGLV